ncbi:hypothetical protein ACOTWI_11195, partial [Aliarcobacter butzleri]
QPEILLLDDPASGLDPASPKSVNELLLYLKNSLNITTVIITHDLDTIKTLLDRFIINYSNSSNWNYLISNNRNKPSWI